MNRCAHSICIWVHLLAPRKDLITAFGRRLLGLLEPEVSVSIQILFVRYMCVDTYLLLTLLFHVRPKWYDQCGTAIDDDT